MLRKLFQVAPEIKADGAAGSLVARFAKFNVIDSDNDVTLPGAFGEQQVRIQPWGHQTGEPTIGKGNIREEGEFALLDGLINLQMAKGRENYECLKFDITNGQPLVEWSYIYDIIDAAPGQMAGQDVQFLRKLKVHSVEPVYLGAGLETATLSVKERKAIRLPDGMSIDDLQTNIRDAVRSAFPALVGDDYIWLADVYDGEAVACSEERYYRVNYGIDAASGDVSISGQPVEVDRVVSWEPVTAGKTREKGESLADHAERTLVDARAFLVRAKALAALREKEGRVLSAQNRTRLSSLLEAMTGMASDIEKLLVETDPEKSIPEETTTMASRQSLVLRFAELDEARRDYADLVVA